MGPRADYSSADDALDDLSRRIERIERIGLAGRAQAIAEYAAGEGISTEAACTRLRRADARRDKSSRAADRPAAGLADASHQEEPMRVSTDIPLAIHVEVEIRGPGVEMRGPSPDPR